MNVIIIAATTLCGRISPTGFTSSKDRLHLERMRQKTGASLIGANTLREGNPEMRGEGGAHLPHRLRAIVTWSGNLPVADKYIFQSGRRPLIFTRKDVAATVARNLESRADVVPVDTNKKYGGLCLHAILRVLSRKGITSLLIEGGGVLNANALNQGIVKEVMVTIAPYISGDPSASFLAQAANSVGPHIELSMRDYRVEDTGEIFAHYHVIRKSCPSISERNSS